jgi:hypothetical protein
MSQDTANIGGVAFPMNTISTATTSNNAKFMAQAAYEYLTNQTGI